MEETTDERASKVAYRFSDVVHREEEIVGQVLFGHKTIVRNSHAHTGQNQILCDLQGKIKITIMVLGSLPFQIPPRSGW